MKEKPTYDELERRVHELKTDNTQLENKLLEARSFTKEIMTYMTEGLVMADTRGTVIFINQRLSEMLGYSSEEITGKCWLDMVSLEQQVIAQEEEARRARGHIDRYEIVLRRKNGEKLSVLICAGPRFNKQSGQYIGSMAVVNDITERKLAEETLRESEEKFRALFEKGPIGVAFHKMVYDDSGKAIDYRFLDANSSFLKLTGIDPRGKCVTEAFPGIGNDPFDWIETFGRVAKTGEQIRFEQWLQMNNRWYDCVGYQFKPDYFVAAFVDITERKQAEELLNTSQRLSKVGGWGWNVETQTMWWTKETYRIHDFTPGEMEPGSTEHINMSAACYEPEDRPVILAAFQRCVEEGQPYDLELPFTTAKGRRLWIRTTARPERARGKIIGVIGNIMDITERKQAEKALAQKTKLLEESQALAKLGSWEWDIVNDKWYFSEQWKKIHGVSDNDLDTSKLIEIAHPEDAPHIEKAFTDAKEKGKPYDIEHRIIRADNREIRYIKAFGEVEFNQDTGVRMVGIAQDLTERKQAETYREMGREILQILNEPGDLQESIQRVLAALKTRTGVDAVGLRLQEGEDYPYFVQDGFSKDFLLTENTLIRRGKDGGVCRDKDGNVLLECTCGLVISGKTDPSIPLFTQGGSSWMNDSFPLLDLPSDQDPRLHPRNNCIHQGYASIALIPVRIQDQMYSRGTCVLHGFSSMAQVPVRSSDRIVGLIQLNDRRKGRFTLEMIEILEVIAAHVGSALIRKQMEEDLEKSLSLIEATMNSLEEGLLVVDMEGKVIRHNRAFLDLWKISPDLESSSDEMLLEHVASQPADPVAFLSKVRQLYDAPEESSFDEITFADGRVFERYSQPQRQGSQITGRVWCFRDITARKQTEKERDKLQSQLNQAQKMESVGRLAGGVAHDFNNMLGVILGHTEMVLEEIDPAAPLYASLQAVQHAAERSSALTRQLLAFARKQTIAPKVIDINNTVEGMLNMLRRLIGENINLLWQPGQSLQPVKVDPSQIDQILVNLCVNARDAIAGVGKITIETHAKTFDEDYCADHLEFQPGEYILLEVNDNGCGMDKKTLNQIFEPFFTTKEMGQGTGLGLASVFGMVKQNNGLINVYSEPDQGTTLKIYLPAYTMKSEGVMEKAPELPTERGKETILLVEDESTILEMTTMMLEKLGYTVLAASSPGEAIRLAHEHRGRIDLLMTDVVMPEMNGRQLAETLLSHSPDLNRLFMSGYTANVIAHQGVLDEGVHFIQKPFSMKDLGGKLREALEG